QQFQATLVFALEAAEGGVTIIFTETGNHSEVHPPATRNGVELTDGHERIDVLASTAAFGAAPDDGRVEVDDHSARRAGATRKRAELVVQAPLCEVMLGIFAWAGGRKAAIEKRGGQLTEAQ